ncbi:MAG: spermidine synthase, partial [Gammaproteobacteria bacterium]|nr:spermidine synthase [Gammaproteobacteria bacterium]
MALKGKKIYHCTDEWGAISVFQDAGMRYLSFGNDVEQSCIDINTPERLCHNYTQTMMLGFLLAERPEECT